MRPLELDKAFHLSSDMLTCLWGGLLIPKLLHDEVESKLGASTMLVTLNSTVGEKTHISKVNYLDICRSEARTRIVGNVALSMTVVYAFESLKVHPKYDMIKNEQTIKFLRHLRNAGAHNNRFNFYNNAKLIDPGIVTWRNKTINRSLHGSVAFPDFILHGDLPYLLEDVSKFVG